MYNSSVLLFIIPTLFYLSFVEYEQTKFQNVADSADYYLMGKQKLENGQWELALKVWYQGIKTYNDKNKGDPRLGFAFIETATSNSAAEYYSAAQEAYFWSLNPEFFSSFQNILQEEAERILPLMSNYMKKSVKQKLRKNDASFINDLKIFWEKEDPVLSTDINERLIEHWQRISIARNTFKKTVTTVYDTDDRGKIFVKFGSPKKVHDGTLAFDQSLFRSKASELIDLLNPTTVQSADSNSSVLATASNRTYSKDAQLNSLVNKARGYHTNARYEIWIYEPEPGEIRNTIFIFGQNGNSGRWELLKSIEELIPNGAFGIRGDQARAMGTPISAGLMIQVMTYNQLSHIDEYFLNAMIELESEIFSTLQNNSLYLDVAARNRNEFTLSRIQAKMPSEYSEFERNIPDIDLTYNYYRLINDNNEPHLLLALKSDPQKALVYEWIKKQEDNKNLDFNLIHSTKYIADVSEIPVIQSDTATIFYDDISEKKNQIESTTSLFLVPNTIKAQNILSAELIHRGVEPKISDSTYLFGLGNSSVEQPNPLSTNSDNLEMSDLILGYAKSKKSSYFLPFLISYDNHIPKGENLVVHFEVYHLNGQKGTTDFSLNYQITPKISGLKKLFQSSDKNTVKLTLNFSTPKQNFREDLEIKTENLEPGRYELVLTASDASKNTSKQRSVVFEIEAN